MLHMHANGLTMQNIQKRDGRELRRSTVQYFDFNQGAHIVKQGRFKILPSDSFDTLCHYTGDKKLKFGFELKREMCMGWILYYPAGNVHLSSSFEAEEDGCAAQHLSSRLANEVDLGLTFRVTSEHPVDSNKLISKTSEHPVDTKKPISKMVETPNQARSSFAAKIPQQSADTISIVATLCIACAALITVISVRSWQRHERDKKKLRTNISFDRSTAGRNPDSCDSEARLCPASSAHITAALRRRGVPTDV
jgi:ribosomal protein S26